jgi:hypothetical protein
VPSKIPLEQVRSRHLADIEPALSERRPDVERDRIDQPAGHDHRRRERDDAVHGKWISGDRPDCVEYEDGDADVDDVEGRVGEVLDPANAPPPRPAGEQHAGDVTAEQLVRIDQEQAHRHRDLGQREGRHLTVDAHLYEEEACGVAGGQLHPPGNGADGRDPLNFAQGQQPERCTDEPEEGGEDDEALGSMEPPDSIARSCHEKRWMHHRHLAHVTSRRSCPLSTGTTSCHNHGQPPKTGRSIVSRHRGDPVHGSVTAW